MMIARYKINKLVMIKSGLVKDDVKIINIDTETDNMEIIKIKMFFILRP